ncbi:MAG: DUF1893 domain-containing protein [Oscillospiraceae bacterium]|nr:DUF1893 domain-containing protein [Oscillospiraceae bacterium]
MLDALKQRFHASEYACLIIKDGEEVFSSAARGILPIVQGVSKMKGAYLADKVLGRAAALICVHGGVLAVYANIMTESAAEVFAEYGILFETDEIIEAVRNRDDTDFCPMEKLGAKLSCPKQALGKVAMKLVEMGILESLDDVPLGCGGCGG